MLEVLMSTAGAFDTGSCTVTCQRLATVLGTTSTQNVVYTVVLCVTLTHVPHHRGCAPCNVTQYSSTVLQSGTV